MKMYVSNWEQLNLKQKMKVMNFVQASRSQHAKEVFLKELSAIGRKIRMNQGRVHKSILASEITKGRTIP